MYLYTTCLYSVFMCVHCTCTHYMYIYLLPMYGVHVHVSSHVYNILLTLTKTCTCVHMYSTAHKYLNARLFASRERSASTRE